VTWLVNQYGVSERRACQAMQIHRSSYRYVGKQEEHGDRYQRVLELSGTYPYWGYRKIYDLLRSEGVPISRERVRIIRRKEGLQVMRKRRKRKVLGCSTHWVNRALAPNHVWSYDFVFDQTDDGRQIKCLTVVDEFTREGLAIEIGRSLTAGDVVRILTRLFRVHGRPSCLRSDNGPELLSAVVQKWLKEKHVDTHYIKPGSPWENAYNESFNSIFRTTCLDRWLFTSLTEARVIINQWLQEYNTVRPHGSLQGKTPTLFKQQWLQNNAYQPTKTLTG
jgi:transposase InsO family protein